MSDITPELLEKFWMGLCTEEEAAFVESYFEQCPEDESLLDEFEATGDDAVSGEDRAEMLAVVMKATKYRRGVVIRRIGAIAAAACLLFFVGGMGWLHHSAEKKGGGRLGLQVAAVWIGKHNADNKKIRIKLPDSSETILSPGATILYRRDFGSYDRREVKVEGQVVFSVHKNAQMPFIVYSEGVQTTVLGTIFEVTNEKGSDEVRVRLLQGKVVIRADEKADKDKLYFLSPGQELVYGKWSRAVAVRGFGEPKAFYAEHRQKKSGGKADGLANWYMFNNQGLADVFDQLAILYNVDIDYSSPDLRNKYFIGRMERKDSLYEIMRDIALLNHLTVTQRAGSFIIRKQQ